MAYATGSVADLAALLTLIQNTCTANGWTLSGDVLHKGTCYARVRNDGSGIRIRGGTGVDGSNNLTGAGPQEPGIQHMIVPLAWPMLAEVHVLTDPDEVYVVVNYSTSYYQMIAWGQSNVPGLTGTGNWYHGSRNTYAPGGTSNYYTCLVNGGPLVETVPPNVGSPMFNGHSVSNGLLNSSFIHDDTDGGGWHNGTVGVQASTFQYLQPLLAIMPNAWNGETILLPYPVYMPRTSGSKHTLVADFKHIRLCRITYHEPGDIVTLGADKWKLYPCFLKNASMPDAGVNVTHSGTVGYAVRYTGP